MVLCKTASFRFTGPVDSLNVDILRLLEINSLFNENPSVFQSPISYLGLTTITKNNRICQWIEMNFKLILAKYRHVERPLQHLFQNTAR